jgi:arylsulfatase A-like enzyme
MMDLKISPKSLTIILLGCIFLTFAGPSHTVAKTDRPNILVIFGDDIGMWNVGAYTHGMMGRTPNIDRIAKEGMLFTDHYAQPSCTAGRAAFITGQMPIRTGMTTIGIPGSTLGIQKEDPTLAEVLKPLGYTAGQFGKNHLGDRNEFLPTVHGFDEFYGNLYHLNAEEEPEQLDYPGVKNPAFKEKFGPRGVLHCWATDKDDPTEDPKFGPMGQQRCENTGALTRERMKTVDDEFLAAAEDFIDRSVKDDKPFFVWFNPTRMHIWTHVPQEYIQKAVDEGRPEIDVYRAGMIQHDEQVGRLLKKLDDLGITDNTIVVYSTDNGYELLFWPDGGYAPFRGEKGTTWEGGVRVPILVRWPGKIPADSVSNGIQSHEDLYVTLAAAAGAPNIKAELLKGKQMGAMTYKVHLDGYNNLDHWMGKSDKSARNQYFYYDESDLTGLRVGDWKMSFAVKEEGLWWDPLVYPRVPYLFNLRMDPMELFDPHSPEWGYMARKLFAEKLWTLIPAQGLLAEHMKSLQEWPPRQRAESLSLQKAMEATMQSLEKASSGMQ